MDEKSSEIIDEIETSRDRLGENLNDLESRMREAANWRTYFERHFTGSESPVISFIGADSIKALAGAITRKYVTAATLDWYCKLSRMARLIAVFSDAFFKTQQLIS